jgi:hypothetical protein
MRSPSPRTDAALVETTVRAPPYLVSWAALAILMIIGMDRMPLVLYTPIDGQWAKWNVEAILQFGKVLDLSAHSMLAGSRAAMITASNWPSKARNISGSRIPTRMWRDLEGVEDTIVIPPQQPQVRR